MAQFIEQAPGPRGSPQVPHAPAEVDEDVRGLAEPTAKVDNSFSRFVLLHDGQLSSVDRFTIRSKRFPQP